MKKILCLTLIALFVLCLPLAGCESKNGTLSLSNYNDITPSTDITGYIASENVTGKEDRIGISIVNHTDNTYTFYNDYLVEVKVDGVWYTIPYEADLKYTLEEMSIEPNAMIQDYVYIGNLDYNLGAGEYRILKYVSFEKVIIEFTIQ